MLLIKKSAFPQKLLVKRSKKFVFFAAADETQVS